MEYNYTKEWKQPFKIYRLGAIDLSNFFSEGIKFSTLVISGVCILLTLILGFLAIAKGVTFISALFSKGWMIILAGVLLIVWIFSSLKYDNKNVFMYFKSLVSYTKNRNEAIEHSHKVVYMNELITYKN